MSFPVLFLAHIEAVEAAAEKSSDFFSTLRAAFPSWFDLLVFAALVVAGAVAGKILKRGALALSGKIERALGGKGAAAFIVVNAFFRALPAALFASGIFLYRVFRFPENGGNVQEEQAAALLLLERAFWIIVVLAQTQVLWNLVKLPILFVQTCAERSRRNPAFATLIPLLGAVLQALVVCWGILLAVRVLTNTPPAEILAMIGIGGLAIGLASQDTVKNFFGTAMLVIDCPFAVGDVIDIGTGTPGTVVRIGLRSTRLRTYDDHEISVPNGDLANRVVKTISSREKIRRVMNLGLTYDTPPEKVEEAVRIVSSVLTDSGKIAADSLTVFFSDFEESALNIRVVYAYAEPDTAAANAFAHAVNLEILRRFTAAGIAFAFPTRTVELKRVP